MVNTHRTPAPTVAEADAAHYIGYSSAALRVWRREGRGPAFIRAGRSIRYRVADLDAWLTRHRVEPRNGDAGHGAGA